MKETVKVPRYGGLEDDLKKYLFPNYKGTLSHCYGDPYYWQSLKKKHNMTDDELRVAAGIVSRRYKEAP